MESSWDVGTSAVSLQPQVVIVRPFFAVGRYQPVGARVVGGGTSAYIQVVGPAPIPDGALLVSNGDDEHHTSAEPWALA